MPTEKRPNPANRILANKELEPRRHRDHPDDRPGLSGQPAVPTDPPGPELTATATRTGLKASPAAASIRVIPAASPQSSFSPNSQHPTNTAITGDMNA